MHRGNEDDGSFLKAWMLADKIRQLETIEFRHADIHQDDGDIPVLRRCSKASLPEMAVMRFSPKSCKYGLVAQQLARLVVYHQDVDFQSCHRFLAFA